jgi:hypothetical protein
VQIGSAFIDGLRRVQRAPWLVVGLWLSTLLLALPLALALHGQISAHLGDSMVAKTAADGVNYDWWNEFLAQATGVGQTFVPAILGFAAVLKNLSGVADAERLPTVMASVVAAQLIVSMFLIGGVLDRVARDRSLGAGAFFAAWAVVYWLLFVSFHTWLFDRVYPRLTENLTVERAAFLYRVALYAIFAVPVVFANLVFDYAKIRAVVEDRRSMIGALSAGARFVIRNPATLGLYALDTLLFLVVIGLYLLVAPGGSSNLLAFAIGQCYIVLRVVVRLQFAASQTALFQGRLAHAGYVARPVPKWPDSPAAEAIGPA